MLPATSHLFAETNNETVSDGKDVLFYEPSRVVTESRSTGMDKREIRQDVQPFFDHQLRSIVPDRETAIHDQHLPVAVLKEDESTVHGLNGVKNYPAPHSFAEKISQRNIGQGTNVQRNNVQASLISNYTSVYPTKDINNSPVEISSIDPPAAVKDDKIRQAKGREEHVDMVVSGSNRQRQLIKPAETIKEVLQPDRNETSFDPLTHVRTENKLVIGRITVEVMHPVQPPIRAQERIVKQKTTGVVSGKSFAMNNKLSFGLGQL